MYQGDHLQIVYNFWLPADMLAGQTPWFHNLYEFNTGDDSERKVYGSYNAPFSLVFALGYYLAGRAAGWNLVGLCSIFLSLLFLRSLLEQYVRPKGLALLAALIAVGLPYQWHALLGGSPTGYSMTWVALLVWGIDRAVRNTSWAGGLAIATALAAAFWNDSHVIFFGLLLAPIWGLLTLVHEPTTPWRNLRYWLRLVAIGIPSILMLLLIVIMGRAKEGVIEAGGLAEGRNWHEVALFSAKAEGLWAWRSFGHEASIYLGWLFPLLLVLGLLAALTHRHRSPSTTPRYTLATVMLLGATILIICLGLGPFGPMGGRLFAMAREHLGPYAFIRQPAKIFCILPPFMGTLSALSLLALSNLPGRLRSPGRYLCLLLPLLILGDYALQIRPSICLLDTEQGAYAAVAQDAHDRKQDPRALIIPLWPGDSSWASIYEHYVSLYRIRMINGYRPIIPQTYKDNIFERFGYANLGRLTDEDLDDLQARGIEYILLHENAFPEKVSAFPVAFTLQRLLRHPRLELLAQDGPVWAFRILSRKRDTTSITAPQWNLFFPNQLVEMEASKGPGAHYGEDKDASANRFLRLQEPATMTTPTTWRTWNAPQAAFLLRVRGHGRLSFRLANAQDEALDVPAQTLEILNPDWTWLRFPLPDGLDIQQLKPVFNWKSGQIDLDLLLLYAGPNIFLKTGASTFWEAPLFFHAGYTDLTRQRVQLSTRTEPAEGVFYGPKLPLGAGVFELELVFEAEAPVGTTLGSFAADCHGQKTDGVPVKVGTRCLLQVDQRHRDLPLNAIFTYNRTANMKILGIKVTRTD